MVVKEFTPEGIPEPIDDPHFPKLIKSEKSFFGRSCNAVDESVNAMRTDGAMKVKGTGDRMAIYLEDFKSEEDDDDGVSTYDKANVDMSVISDLARRDDK